MRFPNKYWQKFTVGRKWDDQNDQCPEEGGHDHFYWVGMGIYEFAEM